MNAKTTAYDADHRADTAQRVPFTELVGPTLYAGEGIADLISGGALFLRRYLEGWRRRRATSLCRFSPLKRRSLLFPRPASVTGREAGADEEGHRNAPRASADGSFHPDACAPDADPPRGSTRAPRLAHRRTSSHPRRTRPCDPGTRSVGRDRRRRVDAGRIRARSRRPRCRRGSSAASYTGRRTRAPPRR